MSSGSKLLSVVNGDVILSFDIPFDFHESLLLFVDVKQPQILNNFVIHLKKNILLH